MTEPLEDRAVKCPFCNTINTLIGSYVSPHAEVACSHCRMPLGHHGDVFAKTPCSAERSALVFADDPGLASGASR
ncbi:hypothetical protein [Pelagibacterium montanilacus]|uniref:hypothetical protein n=1 Tax=Pelagibacterium montanilacus TaxID=2185280 RepID=UPI000F8DC73E|nr:hypothetical protein [Pelagibacterium montanilacus]